MPPCFLFFRGLRLVVRVVNKTRGTVLAKDAQRAVGFLDRGRGLMMRPPLPSGSGLILDPCNSIHMFFMRYALDIIFLDKHDRVVFLYNGIKPWRVGRIVRGARLAIELPEGAITRTQTTNGDEIELI